MREGDAVPFSLDQMERQYRAGGVTAALGRPPLAYAEGVLRRRRHGDQLRPVPAPSRGRARALASAVRPRPRPRRAVRHLRRGRGGADGAARCPAQRRRRATVSASAHTGSAGTTARSPAGSPTTAAEAPRRRSMTETYLPRATTAGARLAVGQRVDRLVVERRAGAAVATAAIVSDRAGATSRIRFGTVIVCGGAIQTPALLQRSGLGRRLGAHPRRPSDRQARRPLRRRGQRSRRRPGPPGQRVRTRLVVRRLGVQSRRWSRCR